MPILKTLRNLSSSYVSRKGGMVIIHFSQRETIMVLSFARFEIAEKAPCKTRKCALKTETAYPIYGKNHSLSRGRNKHTHGKGAIANNMCAKKLDRLIKLACQNLLTFDDKVNTEENQ